MDTMVDNIIEAQCNLSEAGPEVETKEAVANCRQPRRFPHPFPFPLPAGEEI